MAHLANLNGVSENLLIKPRFFSTEKAQKRVTTIRFSCKITEGSHEKQGAVELPTNSFTSQKQTTRRAVLGLAAVALSLQLRTGSSLAEGNGFFIEGPLPIPPIYNKIANEETGTRSFLKKGVYVADVGAKARAYRIKKSAFDLICLGDLLGKEAWNYVRQYLRLKGTFLYYDFDNVISAAPADDKQPLTDLANKLFDNVEKLEYAVRKHDTPQTESCYRDTTTVLQEVMNRMGDYELSAKYNYSRKFTKWNGGGLSS